MYWDGSVEDIDLIVYREINSIVSLIQRVFCLTVKHNRVPSSLTYCCNNFGISDSTQSIVQLLVITGGENAMIGLHHCHDILHDIGVA